MTLTVEGHRAILHFTGIFLRVLVNGVDVTDRCEEANAEEGWAQCFALNVDGKKYVDPTTNNVARERLEGHVVIVRKAEAA